jgi:hypothetical protein
MMFADLPGHSSVGFLYSNATHTALGTSAGCRKIFGDRDLHVDATTAKNNDSVGTKKRESDDGRSALGREELRSDEQVATEVMRRWWRRARYSKRTVPADELISVPAHCFRKLIRVDPTALQASAPEKYITSWLISTFKPLSWSNPHMSAEARMWFATTVTH